MDDLTESQSQRIAEKIDYFYDELLQKYDRDKYKPQEYDRLRALFQHPETVTDDDIESALAWKYGKTRKNLLQNSQYKKVILLFQNNWRTYLEHPTQSGEEAFTFFHQKRMSSFISAVFIAHLLFPLEIPIADQHTFRAVRYFLDCADFKRRLKKQPNSLREIVTLKQFLDHFSGIKNIDIRQFDQYLMMFGKHVAPR